MARTTSARTASGRHGENCMATSGTDTGGGGGGGGSPSPSGGPSSPLPGGFRRAMSGCCEERLPRNRGCARAGLPIDASGGMSGVLVVLRFHLTGLQENFEAKASTESGLQRRSVYAGLDAWHYGWTRVGHV